MIRFIIEWDNIEPLEEGEYEVEIVDVEPVKIELPPQEHSVCTSGTTEYRWRVTFKIGNRSVSQMFVVFTPSRRRKWQTKRTAQLLQALGLEGEKVKAKGLLGKKCVATLTRRETSVDAGKAGIGRIFSYWLSDFRPVLEDL